MFVCLTPEKETNSAPVTLRGTLLYYSNPKSHLAIEKNTWPDSARLRADLKRNALFGSGIEMFFFCIQEDQRPLVLQGYVMKKEGGLRFATFQSIWQVSMTEFEKKNKDLLEKASLQGKLNLLPVLKSFEDCSVLDWVRISKFRVVDGKKFVMGWIGGLTLLHAQATCAALRQISMPATETSKDVAVRPEMPEVGKHEGRFWLWWPGGNPDDLKTWLDKAWEDTWDPQDIRHIFQEYHPVLGGFYRIMLLPWDGDGAVARVHWMGLDATLYDVELLTGSDSSGEAFGPNASKRARIPVQYRFSPPLLADMKPSRWDAMDELATVTSILLNDTGIPPIAYGPVRSASDIQSIEDWNSRRFGNSGRITESVLSCLVQDAWENETSCLPLETIET